MAWPKFPVSERYLFQMILYFTIPQSGYYPFKPVSIVPLGIVGAEMGRPALGPQKAGVCCELGQFQHIFCVMEILQLVAVSYRYLLYFSFEIIYLFQSRLKAGFASHDVYMSEPYLKYLVDEVVRAQQF